MNFADFITINLAHDYFSSGLCPCFKILPSQETQSKLNGLKAILVHNENGITITLRTNQDGTAFISSQYAMQLSFELHMTDSKFMYITDLSDYQKLSAPAYSNENISNGTSSENQRLTIKESKNVITPGVFANIELTILPRHFDSLEAPIPYEINFQAVEKYWEYCIITNLSNSTEEFSIGYTPANSSDTLNFGSLSSDGQTTNRTSSVTADIASQYPDYNLLHFVSTAPVAVQQGVRENIQLVIDNETIIEDLPNPKLSNVSVLTKSDQGTEHKSMFQVVKYITNSLSITGS